MSFRGIKHILWDWNGTLLDDLHLTVEVTNEVLRGQGASLIDAAHHRTHFIFPIAAYYTHLGLPPDEVDHAVIHAEWFAKYEERKLGCGLHAAATHVLGAFAISGFSQAILSAYPQALIRETVAAYGIDAHFHGIFGNPTNEGASKVETGRRLVRELAIDAAAAVMIGDTLHDAEVAAALGCQAILVSHGHQSHERLAERHPHVCRSLAEVHSRLLASAA